ncbi:hypothetical protein [Streptomyces incanus]
MGNKLTPEGRAFINFRDYEFRDPRAHGFRWVDIKHLRCPAESADDGKLLAALIGVFELDGGAAVTGRPAGHAA